MFTSNNLIIPIKLFQENNNIELIIGRNKTDKKPMKKVYHLEQIENGKKDEMTITSKKIIDYSDSDDAD